MTTHPAQQVEVSQRIMHERQLLASMLMQPDVLDEVAAIIGPDDMLDEAHQTIFTLARDIHDTGARLDIESLAYTARDTGQLAKCGGAKYLGVVITSAHTAAHAVYLAEKIREASVLSTLARIGGELHAESVRPDADADLILSYAEREVLGIQERLVPVNEVIDAKTAMRRAVMEIETRRTSGTPSGTPTGYGDLDRITGGLHAGQLIVLAARPGVGKSALALNIAHHIACRCNQPTIMFSLEMSAQELSERLLSSISAVEGVRLRSGILTDAQMQDVRAAASLLSESRLLVDDTANTNIRFIAAKSRRAKRRGKGLSLVVVDYLQLIEPLDRRVPREQQVAASTRALKWLAKELTCPVLVLAQLNRQADAGGEPRLSHLRESGAIEQDADVVLFIHRDESNEHAAELIVAKQRGGPCGKLPLHWRGSVFRFEAVAPQRHKAFDAYNAEAEDRYPNTQPAHEVPDEF